MKPKGKIITLLATSLFIVACNKGGPNYGKELTYKEMSNYIKECHYGTEPLLIIKKHWVWDFTGTTNEEAKKLAIQLIKHYAPGAPDTESLKGEQDVIVKDTVSNIPIDTEHLEFFNSLKLISEHNYFLNDDKQITLIGHDGYDSETYPGLYLSFIRFTYDSKGYEIERESKYVQNNKYNCKVIGNIKFSETYQS